MAYQGRGDLLTILVGHETHGRADQMNHAGLDHRVRPSRFYRFRQYGQPITTNDKGIFHTPIAQIGTHNSPETSSLVVLNLDPKNVFNTVHIDANSDMSGLITHVSAVTDPDANGV